MTTIEKTQSGWNRSTLTKWVLEVIQLRGDGWELGVYGGSDENDRIAEIL